MGRGTRNKSASELGVKDLAQFGSDRVVHVRPMNLSLEAKCAGFEPNDAALQELKRRSVHVGGMWPQASGEFVDSKSPPCDR
jgi:hypothetical protein